MKRFFEETDLIDYAVDQYGKQAESREFLPRWLRHATDKVYRFEFYTQLRAIRKKYKAEALEERRAAKAAKKAAKLLGGISAGEPIEAPAVQTETALEALPAVPEAPEIVISGPIAPEQ